MKTVRLQTSELELASNLSSSTGIETDIIAEEEKNNRKSKRLTKTSHIVRYNNPICQDYRKHRKKAELGQHTGSVRHKSKTRKQQSVIEQRTDKIQTLRSHINRGNTRSMEQMTVHNQTDQWRDNLHRSMEWMTVH